MSRAGSVSRPEVSKSLGLEVSRGRTYFAAGLVLELYDFDLEIHDQEIVFVFLV